MPAFLAGALISASVALPAQAQDFFPSPRDFVLDQACDATRSLRGGDPVPLQAGRTVSGLGLNKPNSPSHVFVQVGSARKWLSLDCGRFADGNDPQTANAECLPFFDDQDNKVRISGGQMADMSPPAPTLNEFDKALNKICATPGTVVAASDFKAMMRNHPQVLNRIKTFTGGKVFADRPAPATEEAYLSDLTEAWFAIHAFDHIICGEPTGSIGGLHFHGRYLQLQEDGNACRMNNFRQNESTENVIYTMGVRMKKADGSFAQHSKKGYGLTLSGEDLLKLITRAFKENPTPNTSSTGCWLKVKDDGHEFESVFVRRKSGIRTYYPDATPRGPGDRPNPDCNNAIPLQ